MKLQQDFLKKLLFLHFQVMTLLLKMLMTQSSHQELWVKGLAVKPSEGVVYAPADAEVTIAFETGHAYGLKTASGAGNSYPHWY